MRKAGSAPSTPRLGKPASPRPWTAESCLDTPASTARRREELLRDNARLFGSIGRILGNSSSLRAHYIAPRVCSLKQRLPREGAVGSTVRVLSAAGFDLAFDAAIRCEPGWEASVNLLREAEARSKAEGRNLLGLPLQELADLETQALLGECVLERDVAPERGGAPERGPGGLVRLVAVEVLELRRGDGRCLARLGVWEGAARADVCLPGNKRGGQETGRQVVRRVLRTELRAFGLPDLRVARKRVETLFKASKSCGLHTRYIRTVHGIDVDDYTPLASLVHHGEGFPEHPVVPVRRQEKRIDLYCWLLPEEIRHFGDPGQQETVKGWIQTFRLQLEVLALAPVVEDALEHHRAAFSTDMHLAGPLLEMPADFF